MRLVSVADTQAMPAAEVRAVMAAAAASSAAGVSAGTVQSRMQVPMASMLNV
ncbi:MAG: hypothetical protein MR607_05205 [Lachnospiraceae bacterium]|nr:hypothetical protein [Lachnospiraceae bacterium]